jgi:DNA-directed RNA polymerase subunit RPC12/RpoP
MSNRTTRHRIFIDTEPAEYERKQYERKRSHEPLEDRKAKPTREDLFRCMNCSLLVTTEKELSGVNNRNHCPNCLCSKHVDLHKAGDRKADCQARMRPLGLTVKHTGKKYGNAAQGELMIIHRCSGCGKISINRIAADDSTGALLALYKRSQCMDAELLLQLQEMDIQPLQAADLTTVYSQLFGWQSIVGEFMPTPEGLLEFEKAFSANDAIVY